ncbi:MAG: short-chain dehydrogenase [Rhodospirillaceae bacterium]|nr:short-chain dehydrogenase [Rhodospirillaceae bacterium]|tara:strand:- start:2241 stop:3050 length:810 start_codon:yes stop_codon:yes gene_type:complete
MDLNLEGKKAVVTGGSAGIGKAIAYALAREGADVAICGRKIGPLEEVANEIALQTNRKIFFASADLTKTEDANTFIKSSANELGGIDILVNNAGSAAGGVIEHLSDEEWEAALQLKFFGYVRCTRSAIPYLKESGTGRVVNLIGNDGIKESYWEVAPGAANAAGQNLTIALSGQYGSDNISFCAVNPGPVRTERWSGLVNAMARDMNISHDEADQLAPRSIPLGRIAETHEVADLVTYLCSPKAHFVNGTMIEIDGGQQKALMDKARDR